MQYFFTFIISGFAHFFQHISSCLTICFDNTSMTSLVFSNQLLLVLLFNFKFFGKNLPKYCTYIEIKKSFPPLTKRVGNFSKKFSVSISMNV